MRKQTYPNQPTDDVLATINELINLKRQGKFEEAIKGYTKLAMEENNDPNNYPYILKSWAKVLICLGEYEKATNFFEEAALLFQNIGNDTDTWQCTNHAYKIKNRYKNRDGFINYVKVVSGGSLEYPKNF